jgi:hypothetical protein
LEARNVPKHPDDVGYSENEFGGGQAPIDRKAYDCNNSFAVSFLYSRVGISNNKPRYNFGIGLDWLVCPYLSSDMEKRNYQGGRPGTTDRGYGAALTYISLIQTGIVPSTGICFLDFLFDWGPKAKFEFALFDMESNEVWLGVSCSYHALTAQTGWDRYDTLEVRKDYILAHQFPIRTYVLMRDESGGGPILGVQFQQEIYTDLGKEAQISAPPVMPFVGAAWFF